MKTYNKRIGFLISDQHYIPHGGIGQFCKGFAEMCERLNWKIDIMLDKSPTNKVMTDGLSLNTVYPDDPLKYSDHTATFAFSDTVNFEKIANFRKSIVKAFQTNIYDMLVCNSQESMTAAYAMGLTKYIPIVFYTHLHSMIYRQKQNFNDVFIEEYHNFFNKHLEFDGVIVGTQSQKNLAELNIHNIMSARHLPMPMPERDLLLPNKQPRSGVLFIGRWEDGKNPEAFIEVIRKTGLPAKVLTNSNGAKKFKNAFDTNNIKAYEILAGVVGKRKTEFIKSSKIHFNPSYRESYSFAFLECLGHMPCVVLNTQDWSNNFDSNFYTITNEKDAPNIISKLYAADSYKPDALKYVQQLDAYAELAWSAALDEFVGKKSKSNAAKINSYDTVKYADYINELARSHLAREDFESVLTNRHKFATIVYTDDDTFLSKDKNYAPIEHAKEELTGLALFKGL